MNPDAHQLLQDEKYQTRIIELKNEGERTWDDIQEVLIGEFGTKVSKTALQDCYKRTLATSITVERKANKQFTYLIDTLKERFERMVQRTEILSKAFDELIIQLEDNSDLDLVQKAAAKLKLVDVLEKLNKVFVQQMNVVLDEIDKIKIEQSKMIYDDAMVMRKINEALPHALKALEDQGKIAIIDTDVLN